MGYTTNFYGSFKLDKPLKETDRIFLTKLSQSRRVKRNLGPEYGVEGEFYVDGADDGNFGQDDRTGVIDWEYPPSTQPGLWCQWTPNGDGTAIRWDGNEKFYRYVEWIIYLIDKILSPRGYILNGEAHWEGEESGDIGKIVVENNVVSTKEGRIVYD